MARGAALAGSVVVHGAIAVVAALAWREPRHSAPPPRPPAVDIEIAPRAASAPAPAPVPQAAPAASSPPPSRAPRASRSMRAPAPRPTASGALDVTVRMEADGESPGTGADADGEPGSRGIGLGASVDREGDDAVARAVVPAPAVAPAASRARPPRLIYPSREREYADDELFVARVTIDSDGFVVGAQLVGGRGLRGAERAASAIWRFRYRPALDGHGRPTTVTIEQRFLVDQLVFY